MQRGKIILGILILGLLLSLSVYIKKTSAQPESITLESTLGNVTLDHAKHSETITCSECHHMGEVSQKCTSCHTQDSDVNSKDAFHTNCITCHREQEQGPILCMDCHKKE
jgi:hypothetical protein